MMNMQIRADFHSNCIAGIKLGEFPPVLESNPLLLCKFKLKEILYIVCHEIDHIVFNHPVEMLKANPTSDEQIFYEFNLAADAAVNDRINHEIVSEKHVFLAPPKGVITSSVISKMFSIRSIRKMENYEYYFQLINKQDKQSNAGLPGNGAESIMREHVQESNQGDAKDKDSSKQEPNAEGEENVVTAANCDGNISDHNWGIGDDVEEVAASLKEFVNASVGMMNNETRGLMPGYFSSAVEQINKPPVLSWQAILKKYVGTITANKRHTRTRLNRRQPERFDLSGAMDDKVLKIVVAIDTSASVTDNMISQIFAEIFGILAKRKHDITVIECDAEVKRVYKAKTPRDIKNKVLGRGGTLFSPVIDYINADKYFRDSLLIYFTDGYGESEIPRPRTYRNIWVVIGDSRHLSLKEPYGVVLSL